MSAKNVKQNILSDENMNKVFETAEENTPEEVEKMREAVSKPIPEELNAVDGVAEEIRNVRLDDDMEDLIAGRITEQQFLDSDTNLFDIANGAKAELSDEKIEAHLRKNAEDNFDMSDEEIIQLLSAVSKYRHEEKCNFYNELPPTIQKMVDQLIASNGMPPIQMRNNVAKFLLQEFVGQAELDNIFVDFETSLNEALKIPSLGDLYSEHTREIMEVKIPEIIEKIKNTEPKNAELLQGIKDRFEMSYSLSIMKEHFESNARTRKLMRRDWKKYENFCGEYNLRNHRSQFKMPDCKGIINALDKVFIKDAAFDKESRIYKMGITEMDIDKFIVLFCRVPITMDPNNILDAAYMYYALRNILSLGMTNENRTPFAAELINNICDIIEFIREKE